MFSSVKNILRLMAATFIIILVVVLVVNIGNKSNTNSNKVVPNNGGIQTIKKTSPDENEYESGEKLEQEEDDNLEEIVDAPDTASTNTIYLIVGGIILTSGIIYIHKYNN